VGGEARVQTWPLRGGSTRVTRPAGVYLIGSENSAGVVIDAIRYLKVAREMGVVGALRGPSAWTQKTPPQQMQYADAKSECHALANRDLEGLKARNTVRSSRDSVRS
jgi:hypothetical protein